MRSGIMKTARDIRLYKGRTVLTLIGILIGIASMGAVLTAYTVLNREMERNFMDTNPASMVLYVSDLDGAAVSLVGRTYPGLELELRKTAQARISRGDGTYETIFLRAVQDFGNQRVDTFSLEKGSFPAAPTEMAIERDCLKFLKNADVGGTAVIKFPGGFEKAVLISGRVHAPGLPPASMENYSYGFLSLDGLKNLGYQGWYDEIRIVSGDNRFDRTKMEVLSKDIAATLTENGYHVGSVQVLVPGRHPHADQLDSLLFLLQAFAAISLLAACLIIINLINFIMSRQTKQIAVMKAVGAGTSDIAVPYFIYVFVISAAALALSYPISAAIGGGYSSFAAGILNFNIASYDVPLGAFAIQAAVGLLLPMLCAAFPILRSCTKSVRDGLYEEAGKTASGPKRNAHRGRNALPINSGFLIPACNLLRKKARTILAVLALLTGGVLFMTSSNIVASIDKTVDTSMKEFRWDYSIALSGNYPAERLRAVLNTVSSLDGYEIWGAGTICLSDRGGADSVYCPMKIVPDGSELVSPALAGAIGGADGRYMIAVNNGVTENEKWIVPGMTLEASVGGRAAEVTVARLVSEVPALPAIYMNADTFEKLFGGRSGQVILATAGSKDTPRQRETTKDIEAAFKSAGIEISEDLNIFVLRKAFVDHLYVIVTFLSAISMMAVSVGGLSIGSAIGINIAERKRELGVLRAVGANRRRIISMVELEVFVLGIASWLAGVLLSYPVSRLVGNYFGQIFLGINLQNALSLSGSLQWLIISAAVSVAAGLLPALKSANAPLRDMLGYE